MICEQYNQVCEWHHVVRTWVNFDKLLRGDVGIDVWAGQRRKMGYPGINHTQFEITLKKDWWMNLD